MPAILELLNRNITYESAAESESDMIQKLTYVPETRKLYAHLFERNRDIEALTAHHLGLKTESCVMSHWKEWIRGRFNVCIPVTVKSKDEKRSRRVLVRCPMAHMLAENAYPGTVDEKIGCEVATYAWIQDNCPEITIPHLVGFGFSDGRRFTHAAHRPFYVRLIRTIRRYLCAVLHFPIPSQYTCHPSPHVLKTGYVILNYIESTAGTMLSNSWNQHMGDPARRGNLFKGLARIILSMARLPLPRIGSFRFHEDGTISLTNRPLSCPLIILENDGAKRVMERDQTYTTVEPYVSDLLTYHDNRFLHQPNAVNDKVDCQAQMGTMTILRAISHHYFDRKFRNGPFVLSLTDLHQSNLLVDEDWNITCLIDLEWVCTLPIEMCEVPSWLTGEGVDQITGAKLDEYDKIRNEFMRIFAEEEKRAGLTARCSSPLSQLMESGWENGRFWYCLSLTSVNGMYNLFDQHVCKRYNQLKLTATMVEVISRFWSQGSDSIVCAKVADKAEYDEKLRALFGEGENKEAEGAVKSVDCQGGS